MDTYNDFKKSADYIKDTLPSIPDTAIVLGSGLGDLVDEVTSKTNIPYGEIPNFKVSTAPGHEGNLIYGEINGKYVIIMQGRLHYYEGYSFYDTVYPIRVLKMLGVKNLILTNASGGINESFKCGDFMIITDHINLTGISPLRGENLDFLGPRFNDMTTAYDKSLIKIAQKCAIDIGMDIKNGVYAYMAGPQFETPAEIKALRSIGADAVGMSTVAEVIAASHCSLKVLAIACITNMAAGILDTPITAKEVNETADRVKFQFANLIKEIIENI